MPQLRKDPILGRWVIISTERAKRPKDFPHIDTSPPEKECPFCRGKEALTPGELYSIKDEQGNWRVRVVSSIKPFLEPNKKSWKKGKGPYDLMEGVGSHEVVIDTPEHIANMADLEVGNIREVFWAYCERIRALQEDMRIKYVLIFKNYGWDAGGGRVRHSRSQIIATPVNLKRVKEELEGAKFYYDYHERCVFCDLIRQELKEQERVVLEEDGFVALVPFAPRFPFEVWVLPKEHSPDFYKTSWEDLFSLASLLKKVLLKIKILLDDPSYNYIIHTAPFRRPYPGYWSTIEEDYHWHIEITPRLTQVAGFEWGTGFYICPTLPEEAAKFLREVEVRV
ncbi:MAG: galactose-1-phosphate uridylyltransferase [Candidatus Omnitrophota bacterium]|nr:MAG: galactose-1-phosphate uridylyltransferase [Candidatus Omnitrophota bacterium]